MTLNQPASAAAGREQPSYAVLAAGGVCIDWVLRVERLPDHGKNVIGDFVGRLPGGAVANFACAAARLGLDVATLSTVGDDEFGRLIAADFQAYGVATDHLLVRKGITTSFTVILIEPTGERSIVVVPTFEERYQDQRLQSAISQARALYTMPNDAQLFRRMGQIARAHDVLTMIDVEATIGADRETLEGILPWVDIASFNEAGLVAVSGEEPTIDGARRLLAYGPQTVVVTLGARGSLAVSAEDAALVPGWQVAVQDTTGAGDTFNAAFLTATLRGLSLEERLVFANGAAALATTGLGPRGCLPTVADVELFLNQRLAKR